MESTESPEISARNGNGQHEKVSTTTNTSTATRIKVEPEEEQQREEQEQDVVMQDAQQGEPAQQEEEEDEVELDGANTATRQQDDTTMEEEEQDVDDTDYEIAESDYTEANKISFAKLCGALETLWQKKRIASKDKKKWTTEQKLQMLFPKALLKSLKGGDPYPLLRLIMPDADTKRPNTGMQEKTIAKSWSDALGLAKDSMDARRLSDFANPDINQSAGDLSVVVENVIAERYPKTPSKTTLLEINNLLDELVDIKSGTFSGPRNHHWRPEQQQPPQQDDSTKPKKTNAQLRADWVSRLLAIPLSPLEHKWIVRILLQKIEVGFGRVQILNYISPYAKDLYSANNSLKRVSQTLSDPEWVRRRQERDKREALERQQNRWNKYMPGTEATVSLGNTITPMLANRTSFESAMTDIENRHLKFAKELSEEDDEESHKFATSLALKFPTFICEVKLDGERILVHVNRGIVTMHTRRGTWYSNVYGPLLAPPVRKAIAKYDVDVILDGELIAWDDGRQEVIPFGNNRGVANDRRKYLFRKGLVEERDQNHHKDEQDKNVMSTKEFMKFGSTPGDSDYIGAQCWLKYIVFDVLYVGGPDAVRLISESTTLPADGIQAGSIVKLSGFDRKKILYCLIDPQPNEVELMPSLVVRRNGESVSAANYFSPTSPSMESGLPCSTMDSMLCLVRGDIPDWEAKDAAARGSKTDEDITKLRVEGMDRFYVDIVERQGLEGLIFKDLLAPYVLSDESRNLRYWNKMKPDYATDGHSASDIDGIVLGAYYATGMGKSGILNAFLIGCVDETNPGHFMSLCKVNGGSVNYETLKKILAYTGFAKDEKGPALFGNWFLETSHGKSLPDFISERSFQSGNEMDTGWVCQAKKYPDLWICPEDSFVVTLNCGEITLTDEFSAGISLRFPRIERVRLPTSEDAKPVKDVETRAKLFGLYAEMDERRRNASLNVEGGASDGSGPTRFLSTDAYAKRKKSKAKRTKVDQVSSIPRVEKKDSVALAGVTYVALEGSYSLDKKSLDAEQAKAEGWYDEATKVANVRDVQEYISRHGGSCKSTISSDTDVILGGSVNDARIVTHARMLNSDIAAKMDAPMTRLMELGGIVKWTYVYSSVRRWIDEASQVKAEDIGEGPLSRQQIALGGPPTIPNTQLARPSRHDYLVLGKHAMADEDEDVFGIQLWKKDLDIFDLKRGLEEVQKSKRNEKEDRSEDRKRLKLKGQLSAVTPEKGDSIVPWQYAAIESLPSLDRWIVAGDIENLWNFRQPSPSTDAGPTVLYPDLFDDFGLKESNDVWKEVHSNQAMKRWDALPEEAQLSSLSSCLPLARTMGAQVTPHLHSGVTHVLCALKGAEISFWQADSFDSAVFENKERAFKLHRRLLELHGDEEEPVVIKFVSENWVRAQFDGSVVV